MMCLRTCYDGLHLTIGGARQVADAVTAAILHQELPRRYAPERQLLAEQDVNSSTQAELRAS